MTRDEPGSHRTLKKVGTDDDDDQDSKSFVKPKGRMSKRDSAYFKPTEKDNKVLGELIMKGMPQKERYKINIIPCNSGNMSRRNIPKSKSAEDIDELIKEEQKREEELGDDKMFEKSKADRLLENLTMIATRARSVERKAKRPRSKLYFSQVSSISKSEPTPLSRKRRANSQNTIKFSLESEKEVMAKCSKCNTKRVASSEL